MYKYFTKDTDVQEFYSATVNGATPATQVYFQLYFKAPFVQLTGSIAYQIRFTMKFYSKFEDPIAADDFFSGVGVEDPNPAFDDAPANVWDHEDEEFQTELPPP